jgi:hypothetical protein
VRLKSDTFSTITQFFSFISTQFCRKVKNVQYYNGHKFDNSSRQFFLTHGVQLQMSCPYTSPQNGKAEHMLRTTNNIVCTLLCQASMLSQYWVEKLHTVTYLLNRLLTKIITVSCPYTALYNTPSRLPMSTFGSLGVTAIPTCPRQPHIILLLVPPGVPSLAIPWITKGIAAFIFPLTVP